VNESHLIEELLGLLQKMHEERGVPQGESLENRNILQGNSPSDPNNRISPALNSNERRRTTEIATLFAKTFVEYNKKYKKDEKPQTLISQTRGRLSSPPPLPEDKKGKGMLGMILGGLALLGASIGGIIASISGFFGDTASKVIEAVSKLGFLGALKVLSQTILKKLSLKVLKKLPFIGGLIGFYFAYKEFKAGNIFKGLAELVSAFLNFIPGIGFMLSIGADLLIAWADNKGMFSEGGSLSPENGWKTIKGWMSTIGKTIMDNALYLPVIGTFKRFGMAYDAFKSGSIGEGLKQVGLGILTLGGGGAIIKGVEVLAGWMNSAKEPEGSFQKDNSWLGRIKKWIVSKLNDLPEFLKVPMRWFGILDDGGNTGVGEFGAVAWRGAKDGVSMVSDFVGGIWEKIKIPLGDTIGKVGGFFSDTWGSIKEKSQAGFEKIIDNLPGIMERIDTASSKVFDTMSNYLSQTWKDLKEVTSMGIDYIKEKSPAIIENVKSLFTNIGEGIVGIAKSIGNWIKKINIFDDSSPAVQSGMSESDKAARANAAGYESWEDYKKADWKWKSATPDVNLSKELTSPIVGGVHSKSIDKLHEAAKIQIKLLGEISHWGKLSLIELKRMSGNKGGNNVSMNMSVPSSPSQSLEMVGDNRNGYASSVYALA
jgi:hypothetical protein